MKLNLTYFHSIILVIFIISAIPVQCQVNSFYLRHDYFEYAVNPAVTGRDYYPTVSISERKYTFGTDHSPFVTSIGGVMRMGTYNFYTPKMLLNKSSLVSKSRMGLGAFMMYDKDGPYSSLYSVFNYAYFVPLNKGSSELSFGLSARLQHNTIDESILEPLDQGDPELTNLGGSHLVPDASFGVYYHDDQFFAGASANELLKSKKPFSEIEKNERDYFIHGGYKFFLKRFEMEPSVFMGLVDYEQIYYYSRLKLYYQNYNWVSIAYRSSKAMNIALGFKLGKYYMAYSYELGVSKMAKYFDGSHEIMFGMNIGLYEAQGLRKLVK